MKRHFYSSFIESLKKPLGGLALRPDGLDRGFASYPGVRYCPLLSVKIKLIRQSEGRFYWGTIKTTSSAGGFDY